MAAKLEDLAVTVGVGIAQQSTAIARVRPAVLKVNQALIGWKRR